MPSGNLPAVTGLVVLGVGGTLAIERAPRWRHQSTVDNGARRVRVVGIFADPSTRNPGRFGPNNTAFNGYVLAGGAATLFTRSTVSATAYCWRSR